MSVCHANFSISWTISVVNSPTFRLALKRSDASSFGISGLQGSRLRLQALVDVRTGQRAIVGCNASKFYSGWSRSRVNRASSSLGARQPLESVLGGAGLSLGREVAQSHVAAWAKCKLTISI